MAFRVTGAFMGLVPLPDVLPWESNPVFTRRRGGRKKKGGGVDTAERPVFGPLAVVWVRGIWPSAHAW
jgi:hypothetical protein